MNLYVFCRNNGINAWDYLGLDPEYSASATWVYANLIRPNGGLNASGILPYVDPSLIYQGPVESAYTTGAFSPTPKAQWVWGVEGDGSSAPGMAAIARDETEAAARRVADARVAAVQTQATLFTQQNRLDPATGLLLSGGGSAAIEKVLVTSSAAAAAGAGEVALLGGMGGLGGLFLGGIVYLENVPPDQMAAAQSTVGTGAMPRQLSATSALPVPSPTPVSLTTRIGDPIYVVRGGITTPQQLQNGVAEHRDVPGLTGFSVQSFPGLSVDELAAAGRFPNNTISYTTVDELAGVGVFVTRSPGGGFHATAVTPSPLPDELAKKISEQFKQKPNPAPRRSSGGVN